MHEIKTLEYFETKARYTVEAETELEARELVISGKVAYDCHEHPGNDDRFGEITSCVQLEEATRTILAVRNNVTGEQGILTQEAGELPTDFAKRLVSALLGREDAEQGAISILLAVCLLFLVLLVIGSGYISTAAIVVR